MKLGYNTLLRRGREWKWTLGLGALKKFHPAMLDVQLL